MGTDAVTRSLLDCSVVRGRSGRTRIASLRQQFPQRVTVPMYADPEDPSAAFLCIQNPSAGVFPGDDLITRVTTGDGTRLHLTYQSATQVFAGGAGASQNTTIDVGAGSVVDYDSKTVIPHADASYRQVTEVNVRATSVYIGWEAFASGRIGHGERFAYRTLSARTDLLLDGRLTARDTVSLAPAEDDPRGPGVLGGHDYLATMLLVAPGHDLAPLVREIHTALDATPGVGGAASALPDETGLSVRILAHRAPQLHRVHQELRNMVRRSVLRLGPLETRM
ncbi:urease accessory protein [Dietzia natronolimnaea]|uniref:Urease accessory protein UreD n=1 Tax=Dietzia natronolimnaea TaxID=161920 RepID=A0A2A2WSM0_9ACTN|nr:urease accessory protein UreD [Dietzia natronolimnaea]PAY24229.1 urease accessory protein [Dietzia natronolimnaea]